MVMLVHIMIINGVMIESLLVILKVEAALLEETQSKMRVLLDTLV